MADLIQVDLNIRSNADEANKGLDRLGKTIVQTTTMTQLLEKQYAMLDKMFNTGKMSAQNYAKAVQTIDKNMDRLYSTLNRALSGVDETAKSMTQATVATQKATRAMNQYGNVASATTRKTKRFASVGLQQVGYQVGDFAVQVQGGTNALVALGQQGSQLLGILGPFGAIAGAALAIYTAIARVNQETSKTGLLFEKAAKDIKTAFAPIKPVIEAIGDAFSYVGNTLINFVNLILNNMERVIWYFGTGLATAVGVAVVKAFIAATTAATAFFAAVRKGLMRIGIGLLIVAVGELGYRFARAVEAAGGFAKVLDDVKTAGGAFYDYLGAKGEEFYLRLRQIGPNFETFMIGILNVIVTKIQEGLNFLIKEVNAIFAKLNIDPIDQVVINTSTEQALANAQQRVADLAVEIQDAVDKSNGKWGEFKEALEAIGVAVEDTTTKSKIDVRDWFGEVGDAGEESGDKIKNAYLDAMMTAQEFAQALDDQVIRAVDGVSDAFSTFLQNGMKDFKSFVGSIKDMFLRLLADLAAMAIRQRILIPIATGFMAGAGSAAAGTAMGTYAAGGAQAGTIGATLATGMSNFSSAALHTITGGTAGSVAAGSTMASIGAAAPYILAAVAVIGLFTSKVKKLDEGVRVTVNGMDTLVESFETLQKSRLFGLLKGKKFTEYEEVAGSPIIEAVAGIQDSILKAAQSLNIGTEAFNDFTYQFKVSLQGLTEEEKIQKVNEEITKMGDAFASLSGHFETMNELLAVAQQRYDLETRLLQLQGNETELLIRQRERERTATHELNQTLLDQIYAIEDAQIAATKSQMVANQAVAQADAAFATVQRSIQARKDSITRSFNEIMETIQNRIEAANENVSVSRGILSSLEGASSARIGMSRGAGLSYLSELRGASRITDQKMLDKALDAVANPSKGLYSSFVEYQRDFADQSNIIRDLEEKASYQLDTDEKTLIQLQEEAKRSEERYEAQIDKLDEQLEAAQNQINALKGIDTSVKSVEAAIAGLGASIQAAVAAQARAAAAAAAVRTVAAATGGGSGGGGSGGGGSGGGAVATKAAQAGLTSLGTYSAATAKAPPSASFVASNTGKAYYQIRGESQLLTAAQSFGIQTTGKTGTQLQDSIARITNSIVNMDNKTRAKQFAMGGMFGGGVRMVGERGPELEATGPSRIFSTKQTAELFRNPELVAEVKNLRAEVAGLRSEQRQLQASNSKYVKRNYDINRKWDTEGLPATRT